MEVARITLVTLSLNPADYALSLVEPNALGTFEGEITARAEQRVVVRFRCVDASSRTLTGAAPPWGDVTMTVADEALSPSDALFLLSVLLLTERHGDAFLLRAHRWSFVDSRTNRRFELPHPPRVESCEALLGGLSVPTRVRVLIEACELAVPVWSDWAMRGELTYYDGVMSMAAVPANLAEASIAATRAWLDDGDVGPLRRWSAEYRSLHWPMLEEHWTVPQNVYYSLFAPCNLLDCALEGGSTAAALTCVQQAAAARATNARDEFLGEPFRKAFFLEWWRSCLRVLCAG